MLEKVDSEVAEETNVWKMCPVYDALMTGDSVFRTSCNKKFRDIRLITNRSATPARVSA